MHIAFICNSVWENLSEYKGLNVISQNSEKNTNLQVDQQKGVIKVI